MLKFNKWYNAFKLNQWNFLFYPSSTHKKGLKGRLDVSGSKQLNNKPRNNLTLGPNTAGNDKQTEVNLHNVHVIEKKGYFIAFTM